MLTGLFNVTRLYRLRAAAPQAENSSKLDPTDSQRQNGAQASTVQNTLAMVLMPDGRLKLVDFGVVKGFPHDTIVQRYWLPSIRAATQLNAKNAGAAVEIL